MPFERHTGEQLRLAGLEAAASKHRPDLLRAQDLAEIIAIGQAFVTSDDVREMFLVRHGRELKIGNALGSLFKNRKKWEFAGYVKSKRDSAHARPIGSWRLKRTFAATPNKFEVGIQNGVRFCIKCSQEECACPKSN